MRESLLPELRYRFEVGSILPVFETRISDVVSWMCEELKGGIESWRVADIALKYFSSP